LPGNCRGHSSQLTGAFRGKCLTACLWPGRADGVGMIASADHLASGQLILLRKQSEAYDKRKSLARGRQATLKGALPPHNESRVRRESDTEGAGVDCGARQSDAAAR
jgi:hypothetical protein